MTLRPHLGSSVELRKWQVLTHLGPVLMVNVELRILDNLFADDRYRKPDLGMFSRPAEVRVRLDLSDNVGSTYYL